MGFNVKKVKEKKKREKKRGFNVRTQVTEKKQSIFKLVGVFCKMKMGFIFQYKVGKGKRKRQMIQGKKNKDKCKNTRKEKT